MPPRDAELMGFDPDFLRELLDTVPAMVSYWDTDQRCRFANHAYERWLGIAPNSIVGMTATELLGPMYPLNRPHIEAALRGEPQEFEREVPDPTGGRPRHALAHYMPDVVGGVVRGFLAMVTDVSEIKRGARDREDLLSRERLARQHAEAANAELRESEERFRLTMDEAPIGMALVALDHRFVRVNRVLCEIVGYSAEELIGLTFESITHPEDVATDVAEAGRLLRGEMPRYQRAKRYIRKDGTVVDVSLSVSLLRDHDGVPRYYITQVENITELRRAEREQRFLAELGPVLASTLGYEEMLTTIAELAVKELADLCIVDVVEDGELRRAKVASRDPAKNWVCQWLGRITLDPERPSVLRPVVETGKPLLLERPSPEAIDALAQNEDHRRALRAAEIRSLVAAPLRARGKILGGIAFVSSSVSHVYGPHDLSLAQQIGQRAGLALENARLYRTAQRATQARDEVLAVVAHDLRNPLNTILVQSSLLHAGRTAPRPGARTPAEVIERAARRMNRLIQDLLDVSRLEAGGLTLDQARVSAERLVTESVESQAALAAAAAVVLRADLAPQLPEVWADRDRLLQVFENLIGNALKFTETGGRVSVGAVQQQGVVLFSVADTGRGLQPQEVPHVFDPFWQARKDERRRGAGLGLPIVKGIVEAHGGRVWVESSPAQGATFFFTIPIADRVRARPSLHA